MKVTYVFMLQPTLLYFSVHSWVSFSEQKDILVLKQLHKTDKVSRQQKYPWQKYVNFGLDYIKIG
jgi:hypothetical protein